MIELTELQKWCQIPLIPQMRPSDLTERKYEDKYKILHLFYRSLSPKRLLLDLIFVAQSVALSKAQTLIKNRAREVRAVNIGRRLKRRAIREISTNT